MRLDLAAMTRRAKNPRRSLIPIRPISAPATFATDLYRSCYAPVVQAWEAAIPRILATYERSLAEQVTDSPADLAIDLDATEREVSSLVVTLRARLGRWATMVEGWHRRRWRGAVLSATNVDLGTMIGPADVRTTLETAIERNVSLISDISAQARQRIADSVYRGLTERRAAADVAREVREAANMARRRARNIAADQLVKVSSALNDERRRQAGISAWEWNDSDKKNPRPEHQARDGFLYSDDPEQVGQEEGGKRVRKPPEDRPGQLPFCGCTSRAVLIL